MEGVVDGVYYCNPTNVDEINSRISNRNIPSEALEPAIFARPVSTKFMIFPLVDDRKPANVPLKTYPIFNLSKNFNPGTAPAPWSGYAANINIDSSLRNQYFALQKASQAAFIPSSKSLLYNMYWPQTHNSNSYNLDKKNQNEFSKFNPNPDEKVVGNLLFNNDTRNQIKNIVC